MQSVFFTSSTGERVSMGVNEAVRYAMDLGLKVFMVRVLNPQVPMEAQMGTEEKDLLAFYVECGSFVCHQCTKPCVEYTTSWVAWYEEYRNLCSTCAKADALEVAAMPCACDRAYYAENPNVSFSNASF